MKELLKQAVASLPAAEREVYRLRDIEEFSGEEVSARLGISVAAMKSRLHRARTGVRNFLDNALASGRQAGQSL